MTAVVSALLTGEDLRITTPASAARRAGGPGRAGALLRLSHPTRRRPTSRSAWRRAVRPRGNRPCRGVRCRQSL